MEKININLCCKYLFIISNFYLNKPDALIYTYYAYIITKYICYNTSKYMVYYIFCIISNKIKKISLKKNKIIKQKKILDKQINQIIMNNIEHSELGDFDIIDFE